MYSKLTIDDPIRQGDIFRWLPKAEVLLGDANLPIIYESMANGQKEVDWLSFAKTPQIITASVAVRSVFGIVISQDCDASRMEKVAFAEIKPFKEIYKSLVEPPTPKAIVSIVTDHSRKNQKYYFLSESSELGFDRKMGVDFESIFEVNRNMLVNHIELLRLGRIEDEVAWPHFRERIAEFFRRYPYNEWYPLNAAETTHYENDNKNRNPNFILDPRYRWQSS